ncbi:MAG: ArsR family transcriptional regulator [Ignavibacteriales bacterium]|nr:ArsR family transcriptional regulator [Ignavibacteriales bacterium]
MSDPTRTKIIFALSQENELCVSDIAFNYGDHQFGNIPSAKDIKKYETGKI